MKSLTIQINQYRWYFIIWMTQTRTPDIVIPHCSPKPLVIFQFDLAVRHFIYQTFCTRDQNNSLFLFVFVLYFAFSLSLSLFAFCSPFGCKLKWWHWQGWHGEIVIVEANNCPFFNSIENRSDFLCTNACHCSFGVWLIDAGKKNRAHSAIRIKGSINLGDGKNEDHSICPEIDSFQGREYSLFPFSVASDESQCRKAKNVTSTTRAIKRKRERDANNNIIISDWIWSHSFGNWINEINEWPKLKN